MTNLSITNSDMTRTVEIDNGDSTGHRTVYDAKGSIKSEEKLTDLQIPADPEPTETEALQAKIADLEAALQVVAAPMVDDVKTTDEERGKLVALFVDVPDADKPVAMQAVVRPDTIPLDLKKISDDKDV